MNVNIQQRKSYVMREKLLRYKSVFELFKKLYNLCKMLMVDQHFDYCYCNITNHQCWLCNLSDYVRHLDIQSDLLRYRKQENELIDIAYRFLYYIKRIKRDKLDFEDEEFVLDFFKSKFDCATTFNEVIKTDINKLIKTYSF